MPLAFQIVNKIQSMSRLFIVSSSGGKCLHNSTLKTMAGNCTPMSSLGQIKPLWKVTELNFSQDFSPVKLYPIKTASNEDAPSFPFGFAFWRKWELLKKHFICLQLRSQLQPLECFHWRQESSPAGGSFTGKEQVEVCGLRRYSLYTGMTSLSGKPCKYHEKCLVWSY